MKKRVLFVCLGNICRSPGAEAIFKAIVKKNKKEKEYTIDSAGILGCHAGGRADNRMRERAAHRGYIVDSISRQVDATVDFDRFDLIVGMDHQNIRDLESLVRNDEDREKIHIMTEFNTQFSEATVPDPYYGGVSGFEHALDLLEDACEGLYQYTQKD